MRDATPKSGHNQWAIALTVTLATIMEVLDTSIANVSLPHIAGSLGASEDQATWIITSYLVSCPGQIVIGGGPVILFKLHPLMRIADRCTRLRRSQNDRDSSLVSNAVVLPVAAILRRSLAVSAST